MEAFLSAVIYISLLLQRTDLTFLFITTKIIMTLPGVTDITFVALNDIIRLQAERNYTRFFFTIKGISFCQNPEGI